MILYIKKNEDVNIMGIINNDSMEKMFSTIMQDENLQHELVTKKTIEEAYKFCTSISGGYTIEELKDFLNKAEEQFTKVSGGMKLNNKALSTVLATMAIASPLAGAAGQTQDQPQPSKISGFVKSIKEKISKHPTEAALGGTATVGALILAARKYFSNHSNEKNGNESANGNHGSTAPRNSHTSRSVPKYLEGIDLNCLVATGEHGSTTQNRFNDVVNLFNNFSDNIKSKSAKELAELCKAAKKNSIYSHAKTIRRILHGINPFWDTNKFQEFYFYSRKEIKDGLNLNKTRNFNEEISNPDLMVIDTSDISQLENLIIKYKSRTNIFTRSLEVDELLNISNDQKAIIIRYVQANYLHEQRRL